MHAITALLALLLGAPETTAAALVEIDLPAHIVWCAKATMPADASTAPAGGETLLRRLATAIKMEAAAKQLRSIGLEYARPAARPASSGTSGAELTLCAVVPSSAPAPQGAVFQLSEPHRIGLAALCSDTELDACGAALEGAMKQPPWSLDDARLAAAVRRLHPALTAARTAENASASLLSTHDIILAGAAPVTASPASLTVVALLVDAPEPAPTSPPRPPAVPNEAGTGDGSVKPPITTIRRQ
jgi:hypothetical protein